MSPAGYTPEESAQIAEYVRELGGAGGPMLRRAAARDPAGNRLLTAAILLVDGPLPLDDDPTPPMGTRWPRDGD